VGDADVAISALVVLTAEPTGLLPEQALPILLLQLHLTSSLHDSGIFVKLEVVKPIQATRAQVREIVRLMMIAAAGHPSEPLTPGARRVFRRWLARKLDVSAIKIRSRS